MIINKSISLPLIVYSISHALVDATSILLVLGGVDVRQDLFFYIVLYNALAFGLQLPFGALIDRFKRPALASALGLFFIVFALLSFRNPLLAVSLVGIGNALFHVGGGTISLNLYPNKAALPGVFVSTGGLGLFAGGFIAIKYAYLPNPFIIGLLVFGVLILLLKPTKINYTKPNQPTPRKSNYISLAVSLILMTILFRSLVGLSLNFDWKVDTETTLLLSISIALGKGLGGFIADKLGWINATIWGLLIATICIYFGFQHTAFGLLGLFFFNITMPVTLVAFSNMFPGKPGLSFGLTTMALLLGSLPTFFSTKTFFRNDLLLIVLIGASSILLYLGLRYYQKCFRGNS